MNIYEAKDKGKWAARAVLALLPVLILTGLSFVPATTDNRLWPLPHHTYVGLIIILGLVYMVLATALIAMIAVGVHALCEKAEWG